MDELKKTISVHVEKRHKDEFVSWFEHEVIIILIFSLFN